MSTTEPVAPGRGFGTAVVGTVIPAVLVFGLLALNLVYAPSTKRTFDDFGITLPWLTQNTIRVSNWVCDYWWVLVPVLALAGIANFVLLKALGRSGRFVSGVWIVGTSSCLLAIIAATFVSMWLPLAKLKEGLAN